IPYQPDAPASESPRGSVPVQREWDKGRCSLIRSVITRTVNEFIVFWPIPGYQGAASGRPPRSWHLGRRSGRVPAWPDPPPKLLQSPPDHGHQAMHGRVEGRRHAEGHGDVGVAGVLAPGAQTERPGGVPAGEGWAWRLTLTSRCFFRSV